MNESQVVEALLELISEGQRPIDLARDIGISRQYLHDILHYRRPPGPKVLAYLGLEKKETFVKVRP